MTNEAGKSLFRAANVWCRCAQYFLLFTLVARCLETIDVCIWHMFVFMSVGNVCCVAAIVKNIFFLAFEC